MGHKINPQFYRLGTSVDWNYQMRDPLLANIFVYRLIRAMVMHYSAPYVTYDVGRTPAVTHQRTGRRLIRRYSGQVLPVKKVKAVLASRKRMVKNPYFNFSFVFSHLNISYSPSFFISIFLLDGTAERKRLKKKLPEKYFYYLSGKITKRPYYYHLHLRSLMYARKKTSVSVRPYKFYYFRRVRKILNSRILRRRSRSLQTLFNNAKRKYHIEHVLARSKTKLIRKRKFLLKLQKSSKNKAFKLLPIATYFYHLRQKRMKRLYNMQAGKETRTQRKFLRNLIRKIKRQKPRLKKFKPFSAMSTRKKKVTNKKQSMAKFVRDMKVLLNKKKKVLKEPSLPNRSKMSPTVSKHSYPPRSNQMARNSTRHNKKTPFFKKPKIKYKFLPPKKLSVAALKRLRLKRVHASSRQMKLLRKSMRPRKIRHRRRYKRTFSRIYDPIYKRCIRTKEPWIAKNVKGIKHIPYIYSLKRMLIRRIRRHKLHIQGAHYFLRPPYKLVNRELWVKKNPRNRKEKTKIRIKFRKIFRYRKPRVLKYVPKQIMLPRRFPVWLANFIPYLTIKHTSYKILKNVRLVLYLLRYFKLYNSINSKRRILFFHLLIKGISTVLTLIPLTILAKKLFVFLHECYMYLYSFRYLHFKYNRKLYQSRFIRLNLLSKFILFSLKKVSFIGHETNLILRYYGLHNRNYSAQFLVNFMIIRLGQYFKLNAILNPIIYRLRRLPTIKGFRFIITGRLTRRERASFILRSFRSMPLSAKTVRIDAAQDFRIMKFGVVGIKIFLLREQTPPYYYLYEFRNKLPTS